MSLVMFNRDRVLNELRVEIARLSGVIDTLRVETSRMSSTIEQVKDHEARIRRAERWIYGIPASLITAVGAIVIAWLGSVH